jgi:hypothetical protein
VTAADLDVSDDLVVTGMTPADPDVPAQRSRRTLVDRVRRRPTANEPVAPSGRQTVVTEPGFDIAPNDPILSFFQGATGAVDISSYLSSPVVS